MTADSSYSSVWAKPAAEGRSTLTREQIVAGAIELLDEEGIDGLSMRNLAARLDVGATTLYWHVDNRRELIALVVNEVYGEIEPPDGDHAADWRRATSRFAHDVRAAILRHPWTVAVLDHLVGDSFAPNLVRLTEQMLVLLERAGFELREAERALSTVSGYVLGTALTEAAWRGAVYRSGAGAEALAAETRRLAETATENAPRLRELFATYQDVYQDIDVDAATAEDFDYGLERVLDGLQTRLATITG